MHRKDIVRTNDGAPSQGPNTAAHTTITRNASPAHSAVLPAPSRPRSLYQITSNGVMMIALARSPSHHVSQTDQYCPAGMNPHSARLDTPVVALIVVAHTPARYT